MMQLSCQHHVSRMISARKVDAECGGQGRGGYGARKRARQWLSCGEEGGGCKRGCRL